MEEAISTRQCRLKTSWYYLCRQIGQFSNTRALLGATHSVLWLRHQQTIVTLRADSGPKPVISC